MPLATHLRQGFDSEHFDFFDAQSLQAWLTRMPLRADNDGRPFKWVDL